MANKFKYYLNQDGSFVIENYNLALHFEQNYLDAYINKGRCLIMLNKMLIFLLKIFIMFTYCQS